MVERPLYNERGAIERTRRELFLAFNAGELSQSAYEAADRALADA